MFLLFKGQVREDIRRYGFGLTARTQPNPGGLQIAGFPLFVNFEIRGNVCDNSILAKQLLNRTELMARFKCAVNGDKYCYRDQTLGFCHSPLVRVFPRVPHWPLPCPANTLDLLILYWIPNERKPSYSLAKSDCLS